MSGILNALIGSFPAGAPGAFESIATATGTGSNNSVTFSSIPSTYQHLQVRWIWRTTAAATTTAAAGVRLNGDSGTNYATRRMLGDGSGTSMQNTTFETYAGGPLSIAAQNAPSDTFTVGILDIHDYASTTKNKTLQFRWGHDFNNTSGVVFLSSSLWINTNAVTSLTLLMANGANNIATNSTFALYGIKGA